MGWRHVKCQYQWLHWWQLRYVKLYALDCDANSVTQLYAALYESRTGVHVATGFSANAYLDVYQGHVNTFQHIRDQRSNSFHTMMADIYSQAM